MYIISACLLGQNVRYDGGNSKIDWVVELAEQKSCYPCCPEILGGQSCPRLPAEKVNDKIINTQGEDVTYSFVEGARIGLEKAIAQAASLGEEIEGAILKANSPSCGSGKIYDGTFSHTVIEGDGAFAKLLKDNNIKVITEKENIDD